MAIEYDGPYLLFACFVVSFQACGDSVLDLAEYCVMQLVWLCSIEPPEYVKPDPKAQIDMVGTELLEDQIKTLPFEIAVKVRGYFLTFFFLSFFLSFERCFLV